MKDIFESKTFSFGISANPDDVYSFVSNPENLPKWASAFCKSVKKDGASWYIETAEGQVRVQFVEKNDFGVLDHYVYPTPDLQVFVPMRVVPNGKGSEITFTLFKLPFMYAGKFKSDCQFVEKDLLTLKKIMESKAT